jgi:hypothetical protein
VLDWAVLVVGWWATLGVSWRFYLRRELVIMASTDKGSEYGGKPGILQGPEGDVTDLGTSAPGHTELRPEEMLRNAGRAMHKEASGIPAEVVYDDNGNRVGVIPYDENRAAQDYIEGQNY